MSGTLMRMAGTVATNARLNIRKGSASTAAPIASKAERGMLLEVVGLIDGQAVAGNTKWYAGLDDTFFWSGACEGFRPAVVAGGPPPATGMRVDRRGNGTIRPLGDGQIRTVFGDPPYQEAAKGAVKLDAAWTAANIVQLQTPLLADNGYPRIDVHRKAKDSFERVFTAIANANLADRILTCAGTFVPRHKGWNPQRGLSSHTWGIAIDLNVAWNGYGSVPAPAGSHGSLAELVPYFEAEGFAWGGYFEPLSICDGMHFELARYDL